MSVLKSQGRCTRASYSENCKAGGPFVCEHWCVAPTMPARPATRVVFFDWDDTLLPSHHLIHAGYGLQSNKPLPLDLRVALAKHEVEVRKLLIMTTATVGPSNVFVVTNAQQGWIQLSCLKYVPSLAPLLRQVRCVSARTSFETTRPGAPTLWKVDAFRHSIQSLYNISIPCPVAKHRSQNGGSVPGLYDATASMYGFQSPLPASGLKAALRAANAAAEDESDESTDSLESNGGSAGRSDKGDGPANPDPENESGSSAGRRSEHREQDTWNLYNCDLDEELLSEEVTSRTSQESTTPATTKSVPQCNSSSSGSDATAGARTPLQSTSTNTPRRQAGEWNAGCAGQRSTPPRNGKENYRDGWISRRDEAQISDSDISVSSEDDDVLDDDYLHVISLGDSHAERLAVHMVGSQMSNTFVKSVKLLERPTVAELTTEVTLVRDLLHELLTSTDESQCRHLDLVVRKSCVTNL